MSTIPADVEAEYKRFRDDPHEVVPDPRTFIDLLKSSLERLAKTSLSPSFILLDAYDEFRNTASEDLERAELCSCLSGISGGNLARLLITTRWHCCMELEGNIPNARVTNLEADLEDVRRYLTHELPYLRLGVNVKNLITTTILNENQHNP
jgi:hypothetical protein